MGDLSGGRSDRNLHMQNAVRFCFIS